MDSIRKLEEKIFEIKEKMSEGEYVKMMNELKKVHTSFQNIETPLNCIYYTHDNGARPYRVDIQNKTVDIYVFEGHDMSDDDDDDDDDDSSSNNTKVVYSDYDEKYTFSSRYVTKNIFVGKSPLNEMTEYSGLYGARYDGNSILLEFDDNEYISIGWNIFSFKAYSKIVKYVSPVGNNHVPYPYAVDNKNNVYLMIEDVVLESYTIEQDPYETYYAKELFTLNLQPFLNKTMIRKREF